MSLMDWLIAFSKGCFFALLLTCEKIKNTANKWIVDEASCVCYTTNMPIWIAIIALTHCRALPARQACRVDTSTRLSCRGSLPLSRLTCRGPASCEMGDN